MPDDFTYHFTDQRVYFSLKDETNIVFGVGRWNPNTFDIDYFGTSVSVTANFKSIILNNVLYATWTTGIIF